MTGSRVRPRVLVGLFLALLAVALQGVQGEEELGVSQVPSEVECRPYIEKALKDLGTGSLEENSLEVGGEGTDEDEAPPLNEQSAEPTEADNDDDNNDDDNDNDNDNDNENDGDDNEEGELEASHSVQERSAEDSAEDRNSGEDGADNEGENSGEDDELAADEPVNDDGDSASGEDADEDNDTVETVEVTSTQSDEADDANDDDDDEQQDDGKSAEEAEDDGADENGEEQDDEATALGSTEEIDDNDAIDESTEDKENETAEEGDGGTEEMEETKEEESEEDDKREPDSGEDTAEDQVASVEDNEDDNKSEEDQDSSARDDENHSNDAGDEVDSGADETQEDNAEEDNDAASLESGEKQDEDSMQDDVDGDKDNDTNEEGEDKDDGDVKEDDDDGSEDGGENDKDSKEDSVEGEEVTKESVEEVGDAAASVESPDGDNKSEESEEVKSRDRREAGEGVEEEEEVEADDEKASKEAGEDDAEEVDEQEGDSEGSIEEEETEPTPEEDLIQEIEVPENLRPREHINQLLKLDEENEEKERAIQKAADIVLRDLKRLYDTAIKPLETLYKYRDLSNRHFGDPEIFSKPLVLFMGPWSGGKSSIVNYLLDNEYKSTSLRTGAEPSPAYFNILMYGEEEEILDGTQLAADWTFSGLQKFGQGMLDRLRGVKLNNKLLEKVNIVEIPGILEIRKQVQRLFPFNDACQWFIDRADIIFLVYDPAKLDVGPETEAILDQLKGREYQTRIILNKADQVKPEELMRVQGALIWNISPLMSSAEPPIMYSTSLWSLPYEAGAPTRLLYAQERAFLRDLRTAIDKRVEHKIASARRFAVRVRNHAKMVDCYLTTYYNHKSFFGSKKDISDKIIENPQDYHIYEGLSTLTNISRYDLPDPDVYKDFFRLNPLYDFQQLSSTCTYFRGCPINRLDVAIAYDLPELVGKYKKSVEAALHEGETSPPPS